MQLRRCGLFPLFACVLALSALVGCSGGLNTVRPDAVVQFSQGVARTQQQAQLAFHDANALAREQSIAFILASNKPGVAEADFTPALDPKAVAAWDSTFAALRSYAGAVAQLLSPDRPKALGDAAVALGTQLKQGKTGVDISPGVATAFAQLGEILVALQAQRDAQAAMKRADPGVRAALTAMADALGEHDQTGVRGTVWSNWTTRLALGPVKAYSDAARANDATARRAALDAYAAMLDQRDAHLVSLAGLRQSLLLLADAHTAAANGSPLDAAGVIALIEDQLAETRSLLDRFDAAANSKKPAPTTRNSNG
jgi:hypothetical protein